MTVKKLKYQVGDRFNKLTIIKELPPVIRYVKKTGWRQASRIFECICDCGNISVVAASHLGSGAAKSCGCIKVKHLLSNHPLHGIWSDMKKRCSNPKHKFYHRYGGRGIIVCERWMVFKAFYDDVIFGYKQGLTLERIDNDKNYDPSNCKWDTQKNQTNNTSRTIWVEYNGVKLPFAIACEKAGVSYSTMYARIKIMGLTFDEAVSYIRYKK